MGTQQQEEPVNIVVKKLEMMETHTVFMIEILIIGFLKMKMT